MTTGQNMRPTGQNMNNLEKDSVVFAGVRLAVESGVVQRDVLPAPLKYQEATLGDAKAAMQEVAISFKMRQSLFLWGPPGTGKDGLVHMLCALTQSPSLIFSIRPTTDIEAWFFTRGLNESTTYWEEGVLLRALRDGYRTQDGRVIPYTILLSDFDRADKSQAEAMRLILDSIDGRIQGPDGATYEVLPKTRVIATANSCGIGDARGGCVSSNPLDSSLLDRFQEKVWMPYLPWEDEQRILASKFPMVVRRVPKILDVMGRVVKTLREQSERAELPLEITHRTLVNWMAKTQNFLVELQLEPMQAFARGANVLLNSAPDKDTRQMIISCIDPYIPGGLVHLQK